MSSEELAKTTPVNPPIVNRNTKPRLHSIGTSKYIFDLIIVANHLNTLTPVGIAIIMVAAVK
jgi:hypothetical protein